MVKQWSKVGAVALGAFTFAAIPYLIAWDRLSDPLASHWGPTGQPDGSMPGWAGLLSTAALVVFAGLGLSILLARHVEGRRNPSPESLGLTSFVSALAVGLAWVTVYLNLDATSWEQAQRLSWWLVLVVVIVALVVVRPVTGWGGETSPFLELRSRGACHRTQAGGDRCLGRFG
jgi:hypothetical protein